MKVIVTLPMKETLETIIRPAFESGTESIQFMGYKVNCNSIRLKLFSVSDCKCVACGIEATHFCLEYNEPKKKTNFPIIPHFNLYSIDGQNKILFTKDHIKPKSKGGVDDLDNLQVMCQTCNVAKGDKYDCP